MLVNTQPHISCKAYNSNEPDIKLGYYETDKLVSDKLVSDKLV